MIIGVSRANRLGNALFNHAHLMAAAWEHGTRYANPCFGDNADLFPRLRNDPFCADLARLLPARAATSVRGLLERGAFRLGKEQAALEAQGRSLPGTRLVASGWDSTLETEARAGVVLVDREPFRGLVRSSRFLLVSGPLFRFEDRARFLEWRPRITEYFRPSEAVRRRSSELAAGARQGARWLVGVHVRRRDYEEFVGGGYFYEWQAYEELMRGIARAWGEDRVAFVVTSDEPIPEHFAAGLRWTPGPGDCGTDIASLGACDRVIGPPSTFSAWAAFAAGTPLYRIMDPAQVPALDDFVQVDG